MSRYIDPSCATPVFQMTDKNVAARCGQLDGYISAVILSIVVLVGGLIWYNKSGEREEDGVIVYVDKNVNILYGMVALILLIILAVPYISSWISVVTYEGYQQQIKSLMKQGLSRKKALAQVQQLYQTEMQASATRQAGEDIASALRNRK